MNTEIKKDDKIINHIRNIKLLQAIYKNSRFFVECALDDKDGMEIPNSNFAIKEIELPNFDLYEEKLGYKWQKEVFVKNKSFLSCLIENYEAAKYMVEEDKERPAQEVVLETYEDLISIYKANYLGNKSVSEDVDKAAEIKYCLGFMFNEKETEVLLIEKKKPVWQIGKFNGIGGKVESGESSIQAMIREFKEETGIEQNDWKYIITMGGDDWQVYVFTCKSDDVFNFKSMESEQVNLIPLSELDDYDLISNLYWLIPMCLDKNDDHKSGINYFVTNIK